jgi:hypothetical protein
MTQGAETRLDGDTLVVRIPMQFQRRGGRKRIVAPDGSELAPASKPQLNGTLVKTLARAWRWRRLIEAGTYASVRDAARAEGVAKSQAARISRMVLLAPDIVEAILEGRTDDRMMLKMLYQPLPLSWPEQREALDA